MCGMMIMLEDILRMFLHYHLNTNVNILIQKL